MTDEIDELDLSPALPYASMSRLDGRRYVVLGAGQGIGRQVAHALSAVGGHVACVDTVRARVEATAAQVNGDALVADVTQRDQLESALGWAEEQSGGIDGVVDVIGMARYGELRELDDAAWQWQFDIVLRHAWLTMQLGGDALIRSGGGVLIFVGSISALTAAPRHALYGAAKAGLHALVKSAAIELAPNGVRVNAVAPGNIRTPRTAALLGTEGQAKLAASCPLGRMASPGEIASVVLFLASDLSSYMTAQTVVVDGGITAKLPTPMDL